jgi:quinol monooxygenase YgiN
MSEQIITVVATHQAKPGKEDELKKALIRLVEPTRKEAGCINFDLHISPENPGKFMFHENWTSRAHLDAHLQKDFIQVLLPHLGELCAVFPDIEMWEKIA